MYNKKMQKLVDEGNGLVGMISEALMKAKLLEGKSNLMSDSETEAAIERLSDDLDTYRCRLDEIYEEILEWSLSKLG